MGCGDGRESAWEKCTSREEPCLKLHSGAHVLKSRFPEVAGVHDFSQHRPRFLPTSTMSGIRFSIEVHILQCSRHDEIALKT